MISTESSEWKYFVDRAINPETTRYQLINNGGFIITGFTIPETATVLINYNDEQACPADFVERGQNSRGSFSIKIPLHENDKIAIIRKVYAITFMHKDYKSKQINLCQEDTSLSFHGFNLGHVYLESE